VSEPVLELTDVRKIYRLGGETVAALDGVDLEIEQGEMVAIMGASGSGKSTLMNVVGCLDRPTSGTYLLNGQNVGTFSDNRLADTRGKYIGFIFQSYNLLPQLNAAKNVELPLRYNPRGFDRKVSVAEALDRVGLADRANHRPNQLSGGQQQRVGIARALVGKPSLLLADEPTGNLDSRSTAEIIGLLQELNARDGVTIALVTHEPEVAAATKRIVTLRDGKILSDERINQRRYSEHPAGAVTGATE
jgi:putative ABC transport system ATP-binding protein